MLTSARISGQREHKGEIVGDGDLARDHQPSRTARRSVRCWRTRSAARTRRPPLPARRPPASGATAASSSSRGRAAAASAATPARKGAGFTRLRQDLHQRRPGRAVRRRGRACTASTPASWQRRDRAAAAEPGRGALATTRSRQTQAQLDELAAAYGNSEISMDEWRAAREPIEQRLTHGPQAARQRHAARPSSTATSARASSCARVGLARPQPAARDRRRRRSIMSSSAPPAAATTASTSHGLTPVWRP